MKPKTRQEDVTNMITIDVNIGMPKPSVLKNFLANNFVITFFCIITSLSTAEATMNIQQQKNGIELNSPFNFISNLSTSFMQLGKHVVNKLMPKLEHIVVTIKHKTDFDLSISFHGTTLQWIFSALYFVLKATKIVDKIKYFFLFRR